MDAFALELGLEHLDLHLEVQAVVLLEDLFLLGEHLLDGGQHAAEVLGQSRVGEIALLRRVLRDDVARAVEIGDEKAPRAGQVLRVLLELGQDGAGLPPDPVEPALSSRECRLGPASSIPRTLR